AEATAASAATSSAASSGGSSPAPDAADSGAASAARADPPADGAPAAEAEASGRPASAAAPAVDPEVVASRPGNDDRANRNHAATQTSVNERKRHGQAVHLRSHLHPGEGEHQRDARLRRGPAEDDRSARARLHQ